ncbi:MAG: hypothetical protein MZV64_20010 [Ignavibacteriales bacterium]|nr:hypothetical protein [Ignavibacteriales bacterium]
MANPIADQNATEDSPFSFTFAANTFADVDVGDTLTYTASSAARLADASMPPRGPSRGTPANADVGPVTITGTRHRSASAAFVEDQFVADGGQRQRRADGGQRHRRPERPPKTQAVQLHRSPPTPSPTSMSATR